MYLVIQKRKKTVEKGRPVETWEDYHKCWCDVKSPVSYTHLTLPTT